jgi:hypothetical protein
MPGKDNVNLATDRLNDAARDTLVDKHGLTNEYAIWTIDCWALTLGIIVPEELTPPPIPVAPPGRIKPIAPPHAFCVA